MAVVAALLPWPGGPGPGFPRPAGHCPAPAPRTHGQATALYGELRSGPPACFTCRCTEGHGLPRPALPLFIQQMRKRKTEKHGIAPGLSGGAHVWAAAPETTPWPQGIKTNTGC